MRTQRRTDGTLSLLGRRFEVPARFRHLERLHLRYAGWDLSHVDLIDTRTGEILSALYPLDKRQHASGRRRRLPAARPDSASAPPPAPAPPASGIAPLLAELLADYAATGFNHEELVGVKCMWKRGWASSQARTFGCLCVP